MKYDIIGDIHGHGTKLIELLKHLGYEHKDGYYQHPEKKVVFLGDFIDRGEHLKEHTLVLNTVMSMFYNNSAYAVMGNHEFNALSFHTTINNNPLRKHTPKNIQQHQSFLNEFDDTNKQPILDFFFDLPLFLELDNFKAIHACWDQHYIEKAKYLLPDNTIDKAFLIKANTYDTVEYHIIETLLKGKEYELKNNQTVTCSDGNERSSLRLKWWGDNYTTLSDIAFDDLKNDIELKDYDNLGYDDNEKPLFVGHYWFNGKPQIIKDNLACLDYSIAKNGKLVSYTMDTDDTQLHNDNFKWSKQKKSLKLNRV
jgi:hypothetical protein